MGAHWPRLACDRRVKKRSAPQHASPRPKKPLFARLGLPRAGGEDGGEGEGGREKTGVRISEVLREACGGWAVCAVDCQRDGSTSEMLTEASEARDT